jgi:hypothetical protein
MATRTVLGFAAVVVYICATIAALTVGDRSLAGWVAVGGLVTWLVVGALLSR